MNGFELHADVDDAESVILRLAAGEVERSDFTRWVRAHLVSADT